ncbi:MAG TPA: hypothetical protein VFL12_06270 [Thermoanaerobaculia bacterium]|nr:hypothetical protein [Thermoanaerobaculia bacterium]
MNREYVLFNLREAESALAATIRGLEAENGFDEESLLRAMMHLYLHVNTAWNARNATAEEARECSVSNFREWRHFPGDIAMATE